MPVRALRLTIRRKLFLLVLLPSFLVVGLITLYSFLGNRTAAADQIKVGLTEKARNYAGRVDALLREVTQLRQQMPEAGPTGFSRAGDDLPPHY